MKLILVLLFTVFMSLASTDLMAKPAAKLRRPARPADASLAPLKLRGTIMGTTESRLFVETAPGVEHMIRIDGRTVIIDQDGRLHQVYDLALLTKGLTVDVELDARDMVKSAVKIALPPSFLSRR